jgi:hypothetical protein
MANLKTAIEPKWSASITADLDSIGAGATADVDFSFGLALPEDHVLTTVVASTNLAAGLVISHTWVPSKGVIRVRFANVTASPVNAAEIAFKFTAI